MPGGRSGAGRSCTRLAPLARCQADHEEPNSHERDRRSCQGLAVTCVSGRRTAMDARRASRGPRRPPSLLDEHPPRNASKCRERAQHYRDPSLAVRHSTLEEEGGECESYKPYCNKSSPRKQVRSFTLAGNDSTIDAGSQECRDEPARACDDPRDGDERVHCGPA